MKISFCTTCSNRFEQLRLVFDANLQTITALGDVEWIILDYNSTDGLEQFMLKRLPYMTSRLIYARERSGTPWHLSVAKNLAHRVGSGSILMNLDCDNLIDDAFDTISNSFHLGHDLLHQWSGIPRDGTFGRIAIRAEIFQALGGYDETFLPMAYQDCDLINRTILAGYSALHIPCRPGIAIPNSKEDAIAQCKTGSLTWWNFNAENTRRSQANIASGQLVAKTHVSQPLIKTLKLVSGKLPQ